MREILFRGKRVDNGEWIEGSYLKANYHWHNHGIHEDWIATNTIQNGGWCNVRIKYAVVPETAGQFTGLTDKNGKKIFEGDILKIEYDDVEVVEYFHNRFVPFAPPFAFDGWCENEIEIIGNVTDNPELLKCGDENA